MKRTWDITRGFGFGKIVDDFQLCRTLLFRSSTFKGRDLEGNENESEQGCLSDEQMKGLLQKFQGTPKVRVDLREVNRNLPQMDNKDVVAEWIERMPPVLVMGGDADLIVDVQGVEETAAFYKTEPVVLRGVAHDMMLDIGWEKPAQVIREWLEQKVLTPPR